MADFARSRAILGSPEGSASTDFCEGRPTWKKIYAFFSGEFSFSKLRYSGYGGLNIHVCCKLSLYFSIALRGKRAGQTLEHYIGKWSHSREVRDIACPDERILY